MPDPDFIDVDSVDVVSTKARGIRGGMLAVATQSERDYYVTLMDSGLPELVAYDKLAEMIVQRTSLVTGTYTDPVDR